MLKFTLGIVLGIAMSVGYVWFDVTLPRWMQLPETVRGNLVSTATESELYALDDDAGRRRRALEVYFAYRAQHAAEIDATSGHPFLNALHTRRATREARELLTAVRAHDMTLAQPALRETLERRFATSSTQELKQRLLDEALRKKTFLSHWLERATAPSKTLPTLERLRQVAAR